MSRMERLPRKKYMGVCRREIYFIHRRCNQVQDFRGAKELMLGTGKELNSPQRKRVVDLKAIIFSPRKG